MITGVTKTGFAYSLPDKIFSDYDIIDLAVRVDKGDLEAQMLLPAKLFGAEQFERLKEHVRDSDGLASLVDIYAEITDIRGETPVKN